MERRTLTGTHGSVPLLGLAACVGLACSVYGDPASHLTPPAHLGSAGMSNATYGGAANLPSSSGTGVPIEIAEPVPPPGFDCALLEGPASDLENAPPASSTCNAPVLGGACTVESSDRYFRYDAATSACVPFPWPGCRPPGESEGIFQDLNRCRALCESVQSGDGCPAIAPARSGGEQSCVDGTYCTYDAGTSSSPWLCETAGERGCLTYATSAIEACYSQQQTAEVPAEVPETCTDGVCLVGQAYKYIPVGIGCMCSENRWSCVTYRLY